MSFKWERNRENKKNMKENSGPVITSINSSKSTVPLPSESISTSMCEVQAQHGNENIKKKKCFKNRNEKFAPVNRSILPSIMASKSSLVRESSSSLKISFNTPVVM